VRASHTGFLCYRASMGRSETSGLVYPDDVLAELAKFGDAGWSSPVARQAHNLKVVGSNPAPATNHKIKLYQIFNASTVSLGCPSVFDKKVR
jgi:hypothetical protein